MTTTEPVSKPIEALVTNRCLAVIKPYTLDMDESNALFTNCPVVSVEPDPVAALFANQSLKELFFLLLCQFSLGFDGLNS